MLLRYFEAWGLHWSRTSMQGYLNLRHDLVGDSRLVGKDESPLVLLVEGFLRLLIESYPKQRLGKSSKNEHDAVDCAQVDQDQHKHCLVWRLSLIHI